METNIQEATRPETLQEGSTYAWHLKLKCGEGENWEWVRLVQYTPCPAVVLVSRAAGTVLPVARDELFLIHFCSW